MINLPDVTLVIAETRAHELARIAVVDITNEVNFGGILIYTDDETRLVVPGARYVKVPDWPNKVESGSFYYTEAALGISTSHALLMEWDAGLCNPAMWRDEFLEYDYIGAPWEWREKLATAVGNGGFALVTKRLVEFCHTEKFRICTDMDISVHRRKEIETRGGFKWAPIEIARGFAYEGWTTRGPSLPKARPASFGYHSVCNWPAILNRDDLLNRANILFGSSPKWTDASNRSGSGNKRGLLLRAAPWLNNIGASPPVAQLHNRRVDIDRIRAQRIATFQNLRNRGLSA